MDQLREVGPVAPTVAWSATFAVAGATVMVVNALALYTFITTASLKTRRHVMIINLTVTDFLFGAMGMSSTVFYNLNPSDINYYVCQTMNISTKTASLLTLSVIAVERMHAIIWPFRHQVLGNNVYKTALLLIWALAAVMTALIPFNIANGPERISIIGVLIPVMIFGFTITIIACYITIWIFARRRNRRKLGALAKNDKALALTLLLVAGSFVVTWVVPKLYISISRMCNCNKLTVTTVKGLQLIHAVQSIVNPVIYCFRLPQFKERLKGVIQKLKCLEDGQREEANEWELTLASKNEDSKSVTERELGEILRPCEGF